jgi:hypothetical protein
MRADGEYGSSTDPESWGDYPAAVAAYAERAPDFEGLAFALSYHLAVIDLDHCGDRTTGIIEPWARDTIDRFATYAEWSPSGTGVHIIMFAKDAPKITGTKFVLPSGGGRRIELYNARHYFTFTADPIPGHEGEVTEQSAAFIALHDRVAAAQEKTRLATRGREGRGRSGPVRLSEAPETALDRSETLRGLSGLTDIEIMEAAYASVHGEQIRRLFVDGDASDYRNDRSSADMGLAGFLAFYTGKDAGQVERIMRASSLARDKWDSRRPGGTYLTFTIDKAIEGTSETYSPGGAEFHLKRPKSKARQATALDMPDDLAAMKWGVKLDGVSEAGIQWLWKDRIPRGMVGLIDGNPGDGKSTIIADIVARVTTGREWPDGSPSVEGGAIIIGAEDALDSVWVPRLNAAGANLSRVRQIGLVPDLKTGTMRMPSLPHDIPTLEKLIAADGAVVIVFDPIMPYISSELNSNTDQHVRQALTPMAEVASRHMVTPILLRHYAKNALVSNAIYRGLGSIGFIGLSRWGMAVARVPKTKFGPNGQQFSLMQQKTSIGRPQRAFRYSIRGVERTTAMGEIIETSAIEWGEMADDDPDAMLTAEGQADKKSESSADLLKTLLADGPMKSADIYARFDTAGISRRTAFRSRDDMGVKAGKVGYAEAGEWYWYLPGDEEKMEELRSTKLLRVPPKSATGTLNETLKSAKLFQDGTLKEEIEESQVQTQEKMTKSATKEFWHPLDVFDPDDPAKDASTPDSLEMVYETCPACGSAAYAIDEDGVRWCDRCEHNWRRE